MPGRSGRSHRRARSRRPLSSRSTSPRVALSPSVARSAAARSATSSLRSSISGRRRPSLRGWRSQQRVERVDHHLRVARARQPPGRVAQDRVLALVPPLAELLAQQAHQRAQALERLARLVDRLAVERRSARGPLHRRSPPSSSIARSSWPSAIRRSASGRGSPGSCAKRRARLRSALAARRARSACAQGDADRHGDARREGGRERRNNGAVLQPAARPVVDGAPRGEPQAGDVPLSNLRPSPTRAQRAHADRPRRRHAPPPPRPQRVRARRPRARGAAVARGVAAHPAARTVAVAAVDAVAHRASAPRCRLSLPRL